MIIFIILGFYRLRFYMPIIQSYQGQLSAYRQEVLAQKSSPSFRFKKLRDLYENYSIDTEDLAVMEYGTALIAAERNYEGLKGACKAEHQSLKQMQRNLDERTLAIEQQLYLGLPNDLKEMEKVINEQESILTDQQKINQLEEELLEKMRRIDIDHGKKLAVIEQNSVNIAIPQKKAKADFNLNIDAEEIKIAKKIRIFSLLPMVLIPIALDLLAEKTGIQKNTENHFIFNHYSFFISFLILEFFFASKIKSNIGDQLSRKSCNLLVNDLEVVWAENNNQIKQLEKTYGASLEEVKAWLDVPKDETVI